ncbi:hypothetical protein DAEQUDRAFT_781519 [Daedalea quercina L-15889]|uniref:Uncharacterized protein n=1 Tax=Daedalea quercina L-15889 TaxID=1314783 RepID=A0A165RG00_9APHY|nr:hypothetical protein DAEQUDRAFT_781519 [Daedalea quercina L-15889]
MDEPWNNREDTDLDVADQRNCCGPLHEEGGGSCRTTLSRSRESSRRVGGAISRVVIYRVGGWPRVDVDIERRSFDICRRKTSMNEAIDVNERGGIRSMFAELTTTYSGCWHSALSPRTLYTPLPVTLGRLHDVVGHVPGLLPRAPIPEIARAS